MGARVSSAVLHWHMCSFNKYLLSTYYAQSVDEDIKMKLRNLYRKDSVSSDEFIKDDGILKTATG